MPVFKREEEVEQGNGQAEVPDLKVEESEDSDEINQKLLGEQDSDFSDEADKAI